MTYFGAQGHYLDKLRRGPLVDPTYQTLDIVVLKKIYHKFINRYVLKKLENTKFYFLKYSLIRNKFEVRWNKKQGLYMNCFNNCHKKHAFDARKKRLSETFVLHRKTNVW